MGKGKKPTLNDVCPEEVLKLTRANGKRCHCLLRCQSSNLIETNLQDRARKPKVMGSALVVWTVNLGSKQNKTTRLIYLSQCCFAKVNF